MELEAITKVLKPYMSEYQTTPNIVSYLSKNGFEMNSRDFQEYVLLYNQQYSTRDGYIASCNKGYKFTYSTDEIKQSNIQKLKKAVAMIRNAKRDLKEVGMKTQLSLLDQECDTIENWVETVEKVEFPKDIVYEETALFNGINYYGK